LRRRPPPLRRRRSVRRSNRSPARRPARARSAVPERSFRCTAAWNCNAASSGGQRMPSASGCVPPIAST